MKRIITILFFLFVPLFATTVAPEAATTHGVAMSWQMTTIVLFAFCLVLGILAVLGGVGGGVLFVPLVGAFFPFHMDFIRGAGLMIALANALSAGSVLLKKNLASIKLAIPFALVAAFASIFGAMAGLALPQHVVRIALGIAILGICVVMVMAGKSEFPNVPKMTGLSAALNITGIYHEGSLGKDIEWQTHRTGRAIFIFFAIGFVAGMFGLGAGWANVPVLNLVIGAPLKIAVGTSIFVLSITDTSAAWVYINKGSVLPLITIPSIVGMMIGSKIGVAILGVAKPAFVKKIVIGLLIFAGAMSLFKGIQSIPQ